MGEFRILEVFKLRTEAYTYPRSTHWLTHSLTDSSVRIMLLKTWERWKNGQTLTRFQAASHLANSPLMQQPENYLEEYLAENNNKSKTINFSTLISVRTWWESPTTRREKNIHTRSLAETKLEQFCYCFICHPQNVIQI